MKSFLGTLFALVLVCLTADFMENKAQADGWIQQVPLGYQQITSLSASTALTVPAGATQAVIYVETQAVRYRDDGTAPTAAVGAPLAVTGSGQPFVYNGTLSAIRFIEQTASAKINVLYYR
jgi:hypothetical protein